MTREPQDGMALVTVHGDEAASLEGAAEQLGVDVGDLDAEFGVVPIDPEHRLYAVHVRADRLPRGITAFSVPRIDPF